MKQIRFRLQKTSDRLSFVIPPFGDELRLCTFPLGKALSNRFVTSRPLLGLGDEPFIGRPYHTPATNSEASINKGDVWKSLLRS